MKKDEDVSLSTEFYISMEKEVLEDNDNIPEITIELKRRSLLEKIVRTPYLIFKNYRILRKGNGFLESLSVAIVLATLWIDGRSP